MVKNYDFIVTKNGFGYISGYLTNSSGHTAQNLLSLSVVAFCSPLF
jgi:hypothetical protein